MTAELLLGGAHGAGGRSYPRGGRARLLENVEVDLQMIRTRASTAREGEGGKPEAYYPWKETMLPVVTPEIVQSVAAVVMGLYGMGRH